LQDIGLDGREKILKLIFERWGGGHVLDLAQDRDKWRAVVDTVMNFQLS
jgi:hypothetical protein